MPKLVKVDNPEGSRIEGPLLHFDAVVPLETVADLVVHAFQANLRERGIDGTVHSYSTTDTPRFRSYGIGVVGQRWRAPLFEVVYGERDGQVYTFSGSAVPDVLNPDERPLIEIDRVRLFDKYIGRELSDVLSQ